MPSTNSIYPMQMVAGDDVPSVQKTAWLSGDAVPPDTGVETIPQTVAASLLESDDHLQRIGVSDFCRSATAPLDCDNNMPPPTTSNAGSVVPISVPAAPPRMHFYLGGDPLELVVAPGDILVVRGSGHLAELGNAGGFMGHVLVVVAPPCSVSRHSSAAADLMPAWPTEDNVTELWRVHTMESTRRESGLYESELLIYLRRRTRQLVLVGEVDRQGELSTTEHEVVELWQSPEELRSELRIDIMAEVIADMRAKQANWSARTAARALLKKATVTVAGGKGSTEALEEIQACWERAPICTSVVIAFWQRYFFKLAAAPTTLDAGVLGTIFLVGERVMYWSDSFRQWMDAVVTGQNCNTEGMVVNYNLDIKCGAMAANIRRPVQVLDKSVKALELILKYMPLKADRALPGDLLRNMRECGWVSVPQIPQLFRQALLPSTDIACNPL